jgi:hypothetical protein
MAWGRGTISVVPSIWIQGPKKVSVKTHGVASEVADLVGGLSAADDDLAVAVDADGDG